MSKKIIVEAKGLAKRIGDTVVVAGIDFQVYQGECFGILGPNGAGKSTTMRMMYGSALPTAGELFILGLNSKSNIKAVKARIGVVPQEDGLETEFTVAENLALFSRYHGVDPEVALRRSDELLKLMRLEEHGAQFVRVLSGGMKRRLAIARSMVNHPELLFLDEPTSGLDPQARIWIWTFLKRLRAEMGTVVLTTHYMEEAEQVCDRIAIMDKGRILAVGEPKQLIRDHIGAQVVEVSVSRQDLQYYLARLTTKNFRYQVIQDQINIHLKSDESPKEVLQIAEGLKVTLRSPTLSDVFLKLAGHDLRDEPL